MLHDYEFDLTEPIAILLYLKCLLTKVREGQARDVISCFCGKYNSEVCQTSLCLSSPNAPLGNYYIAPGEHVVGLGPAVQETKRALILSVCVLLYCSLFVSYLYFNAKLVDSEGEEVKFQDAWHHFSTSPWWMDLKQSLYETWNYAQRHGWAEVWKLIIDLSDVHGEINAHKVLGVGHTATQSEITARWRSLSKEFHPDKVKDPVERSKAQERFMEIQQAYEVLSKMRAKRTARNKKSMTD